MLLFWIFTPATTIRALIVDKTVLTDKCNEHYCINWILKHEKFKKPNGDNYSASEDYYGFFPGKNKRFQIKDFSKFSESQIDSMADFYQLAYFTDTYGVYYNEWYLDTFVNEYSTKFYGGMDLNDYNLLKRM